MASGLATVTPTGDISAERVTLAPVGSFADTAAKQQIEAIGITPLPQLTLTGFGQGIYVNITA